MCKLTLLAQSTQCNLYNKKIENFKSEKYFEFHGIFSGNVTGILYKVVQEETSNFEDCSLKPELQKFVCEKFNTVSNDVEDKIQNPPLLESTDFNRRTLTLVPLLILVVLR